MVTSSTSTMASLLSSRMGVQDFSDHDLVDMVDKLRRANKLMEMENYVMETHLRKCDPKSIANMENVLEQAGRIHNRMLRRGTLTSQVGIMQSGSVSSAKSKMSDVSAAATLPQGKRVKCTSPVSASGSGSSFIGTQMSSLGSCSSRQASLTKSNKYPINLLTKMELLAKERDIFAESVDQFYRKTSRQRNNLAAQIQQMVLQKSETLEAMAIFEERIVKDSVDPLTRQIPLEKFVRHIEDWLRCAEAIIAKLRLRCSSLHYKCIALKQQLKQKEELGDTLLPVDLDQMRIEYQVLMEKLEQKNNDLLDLKKKSGDAGFALTQHKKQLLQQVKELHTMKRRIAKEKKQLTVLTNSIAGVKHEVTVSEQKLQTIIYLVDNFTAPDLLDYIMKQKELRELKNILKVWSRRAGIQTTALKGHVQQMKRLSGAKKTDENWFILPVKVDAKNTCKAEEGQELLEQD